MTRTFIKLLAIASLAINAQAAKKSLALKDLPAAVQKTVQDQTKGGEIKNISKETEKGVTEYEVETMVNGKHRDFNVDTKGALVVVEEETTIDAIPAAAKAAIEKKVGSGKLGMVEVMTKGAAAFYEAAYTNKAGKKMEVLVKPDGTLTKE
jgi:predicted aspartyl protease